MTFQDLYAPWIKEGRLRWFGYGECIKDVLSLNHREATSEDLVEQHNEECEMYIAINYNLI